ncbi:hypothetical protein ACFX2A_031903 [Malus domestica]
MSDPAKTQSTAIEPNHRAQPLHTRCTVTEHNHCASVATKTARMKSRRISQDTQLPLHRKPIANRDGGQKLQK